MAELMTQREVKRFSPATSLSVLIIMDLLLSESSVNSTRTYKDADKTLRDLMHSDLLLVSVSVNTDSAGGASAAAAAAQPLRQLLLQLQQFHVALWVPLTDVDEDLKPFLQALQNLLSARLDSLAQILLIRWKVEKLSSEIHIF